MAFNAQAWLQAHEPPTYIDRGGQTHTGRLWSHVEYLKWFKVLQEWDDRRERGEEAPEEQYAGELRRFLESMDFAPAVVTEMLALPSVALEQMVQGFFGLQRAGEAPSRRLMPASPAPSETTPTTAPVSAPSAS